MSGTYGSSIEELNACKVVVKKNSHVSLKDPGPGVRRNSWGVLGLGISGFSVLGFGAQGTLIPTAPATNPKKAYLTGQTMMWAAIEFEGLHR